MVATIFAFVLIEKIVRLGLLISRIAGARFVAAGAWLVVGEMNWIPMHDALGATRVRLPPS